jgi:hypothetical protein
MNVGIVGLGYVGLPLAVAFAEAGRRTGMPTWPKPMPCSSAFPLSLTDIREPYSPDLAHVALAIVPLFPFPDASVTLDRKPSSNATPPPDPRARRPPSGALQRQNPPAPATLAAKITAAVRITGRRDSHFAMRRQPPSDRLLVRSKPYGSSQMLRPSSTASPSRPRAARAPFRVLAPRRIGAARQREA